jgi:hypothetical protein
VSLKLPNTNTTNFLVEWKFELNWFLISLCVAEGTGAFFPISALRLGCGAPKGHFTRTKPSLRLDLEKKSLGHSTRKFVVLVLT